MNLKRLHLLIFHFIILLIPVQLGYHFWPDWSHVLGRRLDYLSPTIYMTDILLFALLLVWFIELIPKILNREFITQNIKKNGIYILVCCSIIVVNISTSLSPSLALYVWLKFLEYGLFSVYIVKTKKVFSTFKFSLCIAVLYSSFLAILQFYFQHSIGGLLWFLGERSFSANTPGIAQIPIFLDFGILKLDFGLVLRAYGTFSHPNVLGGFLAVTLPLLYGITASVENPGLLQDSTLQKMTWIVFRLTLIAGVLALILTFSRSAWIVGIVGMIIAFIQKTDVSRSLKSGVRKYTLAALVIGILFSIIVIHNSNEETVVIREQLNAAAIRIWTSHIWTGVGLGNFLVALPSVLPAKFIYFLQPVHNIYLLLLSELGIFGFGCMIICIWNVRKNIHLSWPIIALFLLGAVDHYPLTLQQGQLLLAVSVGLLFL